MASTYSPSLKLELIGSGDQSGTWGTTTNTNLGTLLEQSIVGQTTITMANADYTLSSYNGASDEARNAVIIISGNQNASYSVICPAAQKLYLITNSLSASALAYFKPAGGSTLTIANGATVLAYCTGTAMVALSDQTSVTNLAGGTAGQIPYQSGANTTSFVAVGTAGYVLQSNGTSAPSWATGIPAGSVSTTNYTILESGGKLIFKYGATTIASLDSSGNLITLGSQTAGSTP
jgi:hypothetical protein